MGLLGDVIWNFEAQSADPNDPWGETPTPKPTPDPGTKPPVTGDKSIFYAGVTGIVLSLGLIAALLYRMKRDGEREG